MTTLAATLPLEFFARDTLTVARDLIGRHVAIGSCLGRIVETEAYTDDDASHSVTRRNQAVVMRESFGRIYVYLIYGMHYCLNFTTDRAGPGAVLIRAIEPLRGLAAMTRRRGTEDVRRLGRGPGCVCQALGIDARFNGRQIGRGLRVLRGERSVDIAQSPRIGISQATELPWRFFEADSPFVSGPATAPLNRFPRTQRAVN